MAAKQGHFDAAEHFSLNDIALWTTSLRREAEYQSGIHDGKTVVQTMRSTTAETITAVFEGAEEPMDMLRTYVNLGVRSVFKGDQEQQEEVLFALEATFAVEYAILKMPSEEELQSFVEFNCTHNVWPFWRQHVYDTLKRASLPVPVIPFFSGKPGAPSKKMKLKRAAAKK